MPLVKVNRHGQITIPKELRTILGIQEGDFVEIDFQGGNMILKPGSAVDKEPAGRRFFDAVDEIRAGMKNADSRQITREIEAAVAAAKIKADDRIQAGSRI